MKLTWNDIVRKLSSRKFWVALAGIASGIAVAFGADASEIEAVAGVVLAAFSIGGYIAGESYIDGKNKPAENVTLPEGNE